MTPYAIPAEHRDGRIHAVPFEVGPDFTAKWDAYREDGFHVCLRAGANAIGVCKLMPGEPFPVDGGRL